MVIRFNYTPFFEFGRTGRHTTVLCLFGVPYPHAGEIPRLNTYIVKSCQSIWVEVAVFIEPLMRVYEVPQEHITLRYMSSIRDTYAIDGTGRINLPSSGFQVLRYLVNSKEFAGYRKYIIGFEWKGGNRHMWEMEKNQVGYYLKSSLLEDLTDL